VRNTVPVAKHLGSLEDELRIDARTRHGDIVIERVADRS
jgi:hypothetical protein